MMRNLKARLKTLELKNPTPCTAEQEKAFRDILSYLDSLAERKAHGDTQVQAEIEAVNQFLRAQ
jgi:cytochrome c1